jgi:hypothetical protein
MKAWTAGGLKLWTRFTFESLHISFSTWLMPISLRFYRSDMNPLVIRYAGADRASEDVARRGGAS